METEQKMMDDFEWKLREIEAENREKLKTLERSLETKIKRINSEIENTQNRVAANIHICTGFFYYSNKHVEIIKQCTATVIKKYSIEIERDNYESFSNRLVKT